MRVAAVARVASPRIDARSGGDRVARPAATFTAARATGDAAARIERSQASLGLASDDDLGWTHVLSSPEGREMAGMSPRELSTRMLALRDALATLAPDLDVAAMVTEQPGLVLYDGDADDVARETSRVWDGLERAMGKGTDPASSARGSRGDLAAFASACPCAFAIVLRRCSALEDFTREAVVKALGKPLAEWIFSGKPTDSRFGVFGACVGSEWGYLKRWRRPRRNPGRGRASRAFASRARTSTRTSSSGHRRATCERPSRRRRGGVEKKTRNSYVF